MAAQAQPDNAETRERILQAAERLFAEKGFDATSIRDITTLADCNVAAVNYHFGGKESLYTEAFRRLLAELRDQRIDTVKRRMQERTQPTLEDLVESFANAFLDPSLKGRDRGALFMAFIAREMVESHLPPEVFVNDFARPMLEATTRELDRVGPPLDPMTARLCIMSIVGQLIHTLKAMRHIARQDGQNLVPSDVVDHIRHVVRFSVGGIHACSSAEEAS